MASCFVLAAALAFLRAVERPTTARLVTFAVLAGGCPLAHLYTAPFVVAMGLTLLVFGDGSLPWRRWIAAGCLVAAAWIALAVAVLVAGSGRVQPVDELTDRVTSLTFVPRQFLSPYRPAGWIAMLLAASWLVPVGMQLRDGDVGPSGPWSPPCRRCSWRSRCSLRSCCRRSIWTPTGTCCPSCRSS